jgi:hypothetical protein
VALIRTDVSEDRIASIFRVHECEQVTERSCKLLYRHGLVGLSCLYRLVGEYQYGMLAISILTSGICCCVYIHTSQTTTFYYLRSVLSIVCKKIALIWIVMSNRLAGHPRACPSTSVSVRPHVSA